MTTQLKANEYGPVFAEYHGKGVLQGAKSREMRCAFRAFQFCNGNVAVLCEVRDPNVSWLISPDKPIVLVGITPEERQVAADGLRETNYLPSLKNAEDGMYAAYFADSLDISTPYPEAPKRSRFAITNLPLANKELPVAHPGALEARLFRADDYSSRITWLRTTKGIDVTAFLDVRAEDLSVREAIADDICYLLSIARGTKVQWIARVDYSEDGVRIKDHHVSRITKAYCGLPCIDPASSSDTQNYLAAALPIYLTRKAVWRLAPGLIDTYLDAKAEADYLELRGVKLSVAMEVLKEAFIAATGQPVLLCEDTEFRALRGELEAAIKVVLEKHAWQAPKRAMVHENVPALTRIPFKHHIEGLCAHLDFELPSREIRLFVRCRDSLIHRGRFYSQTADDNERTSLPPLPTPVDEYFWLLHVLDRILLRIVGYRGPYIDWSKPGGPRRSDAC